MQELLTQYPSILVAMLALAFAEWAWQRFGLKNSYDLGSSAASIGVAIGQVLLKPASGVAIIGAYTTLYSLTPLRLPGDDWRVWVVGFFAVEFAYYWFHRWSHRVNWLWATHAVHHSANELTLPAAIRLGWTGVISGGWLVFAPLVLLGFPPQMIGLLLGLNLLYQYLLHTEVVRHLGPLEWPLNTPSHHRAHHSSDGPWLDCNFGGVLIIFDRMFGTFVPEPEEGGLRYGLTDPVLSNNPFTIAFRQWGIMGQLFWRSWDWRTRFRVLFGRPAELAEIERHISSRQITLMPSKKLDFGAALD
jgi:sterol desaturase/sphingolipid hydroxylase (fatty acid hydroxylase superfamily)